MAKEAVAIVDTRGQAKYLVTEDPVIIMVARAFGSSRSLNTRKEKHMEDTASEVMEKLDAIHGDVQTVANMLARIAMTQSAPAPVAPSAPAPAKPAKSSSNGGGQGKLSNVQEETLTVKKIYEDEFSGKTKFNIMFVDSAGGTKKIGTWDADFGKKAKAAKASGAPLNVMYGQNSNGYFDIVSID
jgi:hypothetical protein